MVNKELFKLAVTVACSSLLLFVAYNVVESVRYNGLFLDTSSEKKKWRAKKENVLMWHLEQLDDEDLDKTRLMQVLVVLMEYSPFTEAQNQIRLQGYLPKIVAILKQHRDKKVLQKTALVLNNLVLNEANQECIRSECVPQLCGLLQTKLDISTVEMFAAVLSALTNFTTLNESHPYVLPYLYDLYELLKECEYVHIKLQVMKILVNLSTNKKICENKIEFDAELLRLMESYLVPGTESPFILRAVTCCANVLESLQRRWKYSKEPSALATPEFLSERAQEEVMKLSLDENEDIRLQARRCVSALNKPATPSSSAHSMDSLDLLDVLKI